VQFWEVTLGFFSTQSQWVSSFEIIIFFEFGAFAQREAVGGKEN
jgi:hypothetical protein